MKKKCFVIQPITTPEFLLSDYHDDKDHFNHVFESLFAPAIEKQGLEPVPSITKGSDIIQGNIIKNLSESELVLVDMSTLNPNVFFEMGIRTALNKPTCLVVDDKTGKIPFDTSIINYHKYLSSLKAFEIKEQIIKLSEHIEKSLEISKSENSLWKYFGVTTTAEPLKGGENTNEKMDHLFDQIQSLRTEISGSLGYTGGSLPRFKRTKFSESQRKLAFERFSNQVGSIFYSPNVNARFIGIEANNDFSTVKIMHEGSLSPSEKTSLIIAGDELSFFVKFQQIDII